MGLVVRMRCGVDVRALNNRRGQREACHCYWHKNEKCIVSTSCEFRVSVSFEVKKGVLVPSLELQEKHQHCRCASTFRRSTTNKQIKMDACSPERPTKTIRYGLHVLWKPILSRSQCHSRLRNHKSQFNTS